MLPTIRRGFLVKAPCLVAARLDCRGVRNSHQVARTSGLGTYSRPRATSAAGSAAGPTVIHAPVVDFPSDLKSHITVVGNLGRDPELKVVNSKKHGEMELAETSLAVHGEDGSPTWFKLKFWKKDAQPAMEQLHKGMWVEVHGRLAHDTWTRSTDNATVTSMEIHVDTTRRVFDPEDVRPEKQEEVQRLKQQYQQQQAAAVAARTTMGAAPLHVDEDEEGASS